jgi:hypothetical protein
VKAIHSTGKSRVSHITLRDTSPRGPNINQPTNAITGTSTCSNRSATRGRLSRSRVLVMTAWKTMPVIVIPTNPISGRALRAVDERAGFRASNRLVEPTISLDWMVKKTNTLRARS